MSAVLAKVSPSESDFWQCIRDEYPDSWRSVSVLGVGINLVALLADVQNLDTRYFALGVGLRLMAVFYFAAIIETEFAVATFGTMSSRAFLWATLLANLFYVGVHFAAGQIGSTQLFTNVVMTLAICSALAWVVR